METMSAETHIKRKLGTLLIVAVVAFTSVFAMPMPEVKAKETLCDQGKAFIDYMYPIIDRVADEVAEEKGLDQEGRALSKIVAMAQAYHETGYGTSKVYRYKHNAFGTDAYATETETVFEHARAFNSDEESVRYYFEHFADGYQGTTRGFYSNHDPYAYIEKMASSYAEASNYVEKNSGYVDAIALYVAEKELIDSDAAISEAKQAKAKAERELTKAENVREDTERQAKEIIAAELAKTPAVGCTAGICAAMSQMVSAGFAMEERGIDTVAAKVSVVSASENMKKAKKNLKEAESQVADSEAVQTLAKAVNRGRINLDNIENERLKDAVKTAM